MLKTYAKNLIYAVAARQTPALLRAIGEAKAVSFDVFDTLVKRDVVRPADVFALLEKQLGQDGRAAFNGLARLRTQAERQARAAHPGREVTLEEIYGQLPLAEQDRAAAMEAECAIELAVSTPNIPMKRVYDACIRQGKKVLFISDMYLPAECIEAILRKNGYTEGKLYVSSRVGVTKHSGELFRRVAQAEGIERKTWIHIGDSISSDWLRPKKLGIRSALIRYDIRRNPYVDRKTAKSNAAYRSLNHFIDIHIDRYADPYERIGYAVLGPLLYGFARWLEQTVPEDEMLVFLAREGQIMQRAFEIISGRRTVYLYVSRNAARLPYLSTLKAPDEIEWKHSVHTNTEGEIARKYGLTEEETKKAFAGTALDENKVVRTQAEYLKLLQLMWPVIQQKAGTQHELLQRYIEQLGMPATCAVVDVGWHGTMQELLAGSGYAAQGKPIIWSGHYMGLFQSNRTDRLNKTAYLFDGTTDSRIHDGVKYSGLFFEMLFLATHGTTEGYRQGDSGRVEPVLGPPDNSAQIEQRIRVMQQAALRFVADIASSPLRMMLTLDAQAAAGNYVALASTPSLETIKLFADFEYEDGRKFRFAADHRAGYYVMHPKAFYNEFSNSQCKVWFLKNVFKIPLPYIQGLKLLRGTLR